ncbi:MAG TPA: tetratricopeptide repeat protein [Chloroflexota bacterium]|nr:tetratricopeptide repeat protein [Chloroflexota bacterium]
MGDRPFVSVSMIVKNEEKDLARCLSSVKPFADEIVVVDTGSTDRTVEIAESFGASIHYFAWCEDFAAARNFALDRTHGEWVLHVDADEVAVVADPAALRAELAAKPEHVLFLRTPLRNPAPDGLGFDVYAARRLYRNRPDVRWRRPIHEAVYCIHGDRPEHDASCATLIVDHDGYANPKARLARGKNTRNMRILKKWMQTTDEHVDYYYLAQEYASVGQFPTALKTIKRGIRRYKGRMRPDFQGAMYCAAMRYAMNLNRPEEAVKLGLEAVRVYAYSELCYLLGCAYQRLENFAQAERYLELAMAIRSRVAEFQTEAGTGSWKAMIQLSWCAWSQKDRARALERGRRAHEMAPDQPLTNLSYGKMLLAARRPHEAITYLRRAVEAAPTMAEAQLRLSQALVRSGDTQGAYDALDEAVRTTPDKAEYWQWLGELLLEAGEAQACADVLARALDHHPRHAPIYHCLGTALRRLGRYEDAVNAFALAASIDPASAGIRVSLALAIEAMRAQKALAAA